MTYYVNSFFPKHRMTQGWEQAKYVGLVGMFGEKLSINEKLFDGLYLWLFVTVLIMTLLLLSAAYDIK